LTSSKPAKEPANPIGALSKALGKGVLTADMLPSAFDSDSEDDDAEVAAPTTKRKTS
jgi:hypothetical protein